ncbi:hypothetical protein RhiirA4_448096 [Rhizophagus irregularis]|uniref:Uncharacterized protein n=1 Tax=Rhizophagus irregularis TaxID=588596 RepID=A0A2I1H718_9GLOM|nr:hypothetical protein RhiirA4_448096 [Rhizophagus irregularis]
MGFTSHFVYNLFLLVKKHYRFTKLKNEIKQLTNTSLKDIILDKCTLHWKKMYYPAIVIAYYLDPRYHEETSKFVNQDLSGQLVKELLWYNNKTGPFNSSIFWKLKAINNSIDWWNGFQQEVPVLTNGQKLNDNNKNEEELGNLDEIIVIEESEESNIFLCIIKHFINK